VNSKTDDLNGLRVNNLVFHTVEYRRSMSKLYAFVTCIDVNTTGKGTEKKGYWGEVSGFNDPDEILGVMSYGGKIEDLPKSS
jgi:hypothetical protein